MLHMDYLPLYLVSIRIRFLQVARVSIKRQACSRIGDIQYQADTILESNLSISTPFKLWDCLSVSSAKRPKQTVQAHALVQFWRAKECRVNNIPAGVSRFVWVVILALLRLSCLPRFFWRRPRQLGLTFALDAIKQVFPCSPELHRLVHAWEKFRKGWSIVKSTLTYFLNCYIFMWTFGLAFLLMDVVPLQKI